jgi:hypothetical protein
MRSGLAGGGYAGVRQSGIAHDAGEEQGAQDVVAVEIRVHKSSLYVEL